ncbi:MAG: hypothetical protein U5K69_22055 [Balneolaceae bacterium]|nr:hypothetical protein [Balneolaceae bacterium]
MRKIIILPLFVAFLMVSCSDNNSSSVIEEPAGSAQYVIENQSNRDLKVVFTKSPQLNSEIDTTSTIVSKTAEIIFEDGIIGVNPKPSDSFSKIEFYKTSDISSPVYAINQINDEQWRIVSKDYGESGYGLTIYELSITDNQIQ